MDDREYLELLLDLAQRWAEIMRATGEFLGITDQGEDQDD